MCKKIIKEILNIYQTEKFIVDVITNNRLNIVKKYRKLTPKLLGIRKIIHQRKRERKKFWGIVGRIIIGDIIFIKYRLGCIDYMFHGICFAVKLKNMPKSPDIGLKIRNVIGGVGVELSLPYIYGRIYNVLIKYSYMRKSIFYKRSKLYYIRKRKNRASRV